LYFGGHIPWITVGEITKDAGKYLTNTESGLTEEGAKPSTKIFRSLDKTGVLTTGFIEILGKLARPIFPSDLVARLENRCFLSV
jgi:hypothetical protein